jgi:hypothetical protein
MALSDRTIEPPRLKCKLCDLLRMLPDADARQLGIWVADPDTYTAAAISREINDDEDTPGKVSEEVIRKHRSEGH